MLPEIAHQLLQNYAEEIKDWGWICNIHGEDSRSFKRFSLSSETSYLFII
jgi:DNA mismatch repair protein MLH3